jgi:hypothetical protein
MGYIEHKKPTPPLPNPNIGWIMREVTRIELHPNNITGK